VREEATTVEYHEQLREDEDPALLSGVSDDRSLLVPGDDCILIAESDPDLAAMLAELARERGLKIVVTRQTASTLALARDYLPIAILLDIDHDREESTLLIERLKRDPATCHISVHVLASDAPDDRLSRSGFNAWVRKPFSTEALREEFDQLALTSTNESRSLLLVEPEEHQRQALMELIAGENIQIETARSNEEALRTLESSRIDCVVLNPRGQDAEGLDLISAVERNPALAGVPIVVHSSEALADDERRLLDRVGRSAMVRTTSSPQELRAETAFLLHRPLADMMSAYSAARNGQSEPDVELAGKKVLVVDDDVRNIFALSSALVREQMKVLYAENGCDGIEVLQSNPDIDIVLMDIMMPEMDGYDTMRAIRDIPEFRTLPIITLTAKAMKGDRDKCIAAGASDYITKPVDIGRLLTMMKVWLHC
jgi:CheY-like chemotaxis protein